MTELLRRTLRRHRVVLHHRGYRARPLLRRSDAPGAALVDAWSQAFDAGLVMQLRPLIRPSRGWVGGLKCVISGRASTAPLRLLFGEVSPSLRSIGPMRYR